jgi:CubicO group peptidase (beta-lactamase class C family)
MRALALTRLAAAAALAVSAVAFAGPCPTAGSLPYPGTEGWPSLVDATKTAKASEISALETYAFTLTGKDADRAGMRTDGVVIIKGGKLLYEKYARGFTADNKHLSWSVAKSFSSALIGVAVGRGALALDDSICTYLTEYSGDVCKIKVKDNLTFATGLAWQEEYEGKQYQVSSVISMLFGSGHQDQLKHILSTKFAHDPGTQWKYSTGDAELLSAVAKRALAKQMPGEQFPFWVALFDKMGMSVAFEEDVKGTPLGGSMVYATPREYAKFGYLFLHDGCWDGQRLLPDGWVKSSTTPSDVFMTSAPDTEDTPSGYMWWLNQPPKAQKSKPWKDVPDDAFLADGHWGQKIFVVPSLDLVVVRTGDDRESGVFDDNQFMKLAMAVAQ